jgi:protein-tyrosine phosphatase
MKILMVCLGNICRSPLADGVLRHKVNKLNLNIIVDSAGTANYHIGSAPDKRMIATAKNKGVDIGFLKARQFEYKDFEEFDSIFVMDQNNYKNVIQLAKTDQDKCKVKLLLEVTSKVHRKEVPDPYYGTQTDFEEVYELVDHATDAIIESYLANEER